MNANGIIQKAGITPATLAELNKEAQSRQPTGKLRDSEGITASSAIGQAFQL